MSRKLVDIKSLQNKFATDLETEVKRYLVDEWELGRPQMSFRYRNANYFLQDMVKHGDEELVM